MRSHYLNCRVSHLGLNAAPADQLPIQLPDAVLDLIPTLANIDSDDEDAEDAAQVPEGVGDAPALGALEVGQVDRRRPGRSRPRTGAGPWCWSRSR